MSSVHQMLQSEAKVLERYLAIYNIEHKELWDTVNVIKKATAMSKKVLAEHYKDTGVPPNFSDL